MPRSGQTDMAVLGALSIEPMSGYALRESIRDVLGHFWSESFGQIYPALAGLERDGFVRREGAAKRGASTFAITAAGRRRLRELLTEPVQAAPARNGLLLRLFFGRALGTEACRALIAGARADAERRLREFDALDARTAAEPQYADDAPFWHLTISAGRHHAHAVIAWADESLAALDHLDPDGR
ncbi:PadR family transcriptional regulator [Catenuloplanes atrovinosus]|uniref:DNA-binding PadR family transcriptional regulator n=1 Tax=Catenuloplanes atrovinosus TaxID=137266 RepID=A0AAE4C8E3_9ACTN|nr:PadR family transcriptional regulator [Catenuloplanes atrovinosus]MDR7275441.1 DNA-binding PadR family transcriptional regulator [Catenuloplanes atrovinosus]